MNRTQRIILALWWLVVGLALHTMLVGSVIDPASTFFWLFLTIWPAMLVWWVGKALLVVLFLILAGALLAGLLITTASPKAAATTGPREVRTFYRKKP